jgi:hypothetical protein
MDDKLPPSRQQQKRENLLAILADARDAKKPLTDKELDRLERKKRSLQNRRGRKQPAIMPAKLARTSAFAPRRKGLITDSNFVRVYEVPGYSVVEVRGRELGSQHRDAIYALFRLPRIKITMANPDYKQRSLLASHLSVYETRTTWRELLRVMGRIEHVNNLLSMMNTFQEIQQVSLVIHQGSSIEELEKIRKSRSHGFLPDTPGSSSPIIKDLKWDGAQLDSAVTVQYGTSVLEMIEKAYLVSINADVQFKLNSDHAKTFWPFIDSQPNHTYIDEDRLATLAGRDLWAEDMTSAHRAQFRKECREAFIDMRLAGGLNSWREEVTGAGRLKSRRYHYVHASPRQLEMDLLKNVKID